MELIGTVYGVQAASVEFVVQVEGPVAAEPTRSEVPLRFVDAPRVREGGMPLATRAASASVVVQGFEFGAAGGDFVMIVAEDDQV
ncbi:hypothetical protein GCM10028799_83660 [Kribbella italica]